MIQTVFWDFNGTLLDDVQMVVDLNNDVFARYGIAPFKNVDAYRRMFRFPVREFYRDAGVSDALFDTVAHEWSAAYAARARQCGLHPGVAEAVQAFHAAGLEQVVISASKKAILMEQLSWYSALDGRFSEVLGLNDIYAVSKVALAVDFCARRQLDPRTAILIGDTLHDAEVAQEIGCRCILVEGGHQLHETLLEAHVPILSTMAEAAAYVLERAGSLHP